MGRVKLTDDGLPTVVAGVVVSIDQDCSNSSSDNAPLLINQNEFVVNLTSLLELPTGDSALQDGRLVARVVEQPKFGSLSGLTTGDVDRDAYDEPRVLKSYSDQQAPGLKTMFTSSVDEKCDNCCRTAEHLPGMDDCDTLPSFLCSDCPEAAVNAEGPPDAIGMDRDSPAALDLSWVPGCVGCGLQWVVLQFRTGSYITDINIYDTGRMGAIVRVEGIGGPLHAPNHVVDEMGGVPGNPWVVLWDGGLSTNASQYYSEDGRVFSPPLACRSHALITNLRIFIDTDSGDKPAGIDAVQLVGLARPPAGMVRVADGSAVLRYHPAPGIHTNSSASSTAEFVLLHSLLSCTAIYSSDMTGLLKVPMPATRPTNPRQATSWGEPWELNVHPFHRVHVVVEPLPVLTHAAQLLGRNVSVDSARIIQSPLSNTETTFFRSLAGGDDDAVIPRDELLSSVTVEDDGRIALFVELRDPSVEVTLSVRLP
jgi:hypothetical protein